VKGDVVGRSVSPQELEVFGRVPVGTRNCRRVIQVLATAPRKRLAFGGIEDAFNAISSIDGDISIHVPDRAKPILVEDVVNVRLDVGSPLLDVSRQADCGIEVSADLLDDDEINDKSEYAAPVRAGGEAKRKRLAYAAAFAKKERLTRRLMTMIGADIGQCMYELDWRILSDELQELAQEVSELMSSVCGECEARCQWPCQAAIGLAVLEGRIGDGWLRRAVLAEGLPLPDGLD
jgi:hypothetical protein